MHGIRFYFNKTHALGQPIYDYDKGKLATLSSRANITVAHSQSQTTKLILARPDSPTTPAKQISNKSRPLSCVTCSLILQVCMWIYYMRYVFVISSNAKLSISHSRVRRESRNDKPSENKNGKKFVSESSWQLVLLVPPTQRAKHVIRFYIQHNTQLYCRTLPHISHPKTFYGSAEYFAPLLLILFYISINK